MRSNEEQMRSNEEQTSPSTQTMNPFQSRDKVYRGKGWLQYYHKVSTVPLEIVVWSLDNFDKNLEILNHFTKYLKESCW